MTRIASLSAQVASGQYAAAELRAAENMMSLIQQWDFLRYSEQLRESAKGRASRFRDVPGFDPLWCAPCQDYTLFDYTQDPEGACGVCGALADVDMPAAA